MSIARKRTVRRARQRLEDKEAGDFQRALEARGIMERIANVRAAVAPSSPMFWHVFKRRVAARETFRPIKDLEVVRDLAIAVLQEEGLDLTGIVIKVTWRPPVMAFDAVPTHENALTVVEEVRQSERGAARLRRIQGLG